MVLMVMMLITVYCLYAEGVTDMHEENSNVLALFALFRVSKQDSLADMQKFYMINISVAAIDSKYMNVFRFLNYWILVIV